MKESKNVQNILDLLMTHLEDSVNINVCHALGVKQSESPLEHFLSSLQKSLPQDFNKRLFTKIYREAFYTGPIPKNRNHLAIVCTGNNDQQSFPEYQLWIDLDKLATTLGRHYQISSFRPLFIETDHVFSMTGVMGKGDKRAYSSVKFAVNSNWNPKTNFLFLLGIACGIVASCYMLLIGTLALVSLIAISSTGIGLLFAGAAVTAGVTAHYFFQQHKKKLNVSNETKGAWQFWQSASTDNLKPISIETAFKNNVVEKGKSSALNEQSFRF